ncbi:alpha-L-arabinofuranosidase C-terminal domain-containing protein [Neolewinella sp.]|uniref:alpha-L-arabinofuranosidase C-terminal domain-containing protein n=1 Tax=Neolewinella sp. TaxID=2993543 RepID=UPI003B521A20
MKLITQALTILVLLTGCSYVLWSQDDVDHQLTVDVADTRAAIQPTMYGIFFEDINFAADGGLYAEMVKNRNFEFELPKTGWVEPTSDRFSLNEDSGRSTIIKNGEDPADLNFLRVTLMNPDNYTLINEGFRGMGVREGASYDVSVHARPGKGSVTAIRFELIDTVGTSLGSTTLPVAGTSWQEYTGTLRATATEQKARLRITFTGTGEIDLDMISLFPQDTWKGRKQGLRKDLVQLLADLEPGFLRFPGGCIVEGRTLDRRYQWKKTVGPIEERELLVNRWNTEFDHRPTPDYYQSFGLGFFEYFQLAEDLGAEPLPILSCGMACQFNTGEVVPMDELDPYVQDALDLIEFANGDTATRWGKLRADMGHPEPFAMKYIGVGNEQWGPDYIERYRVFEASIKKQHPDIVIISGSGPFPDGEQFEYGMEQLTELDAEIVDEHYYRPPNWFRQNATRYDSYDRDGPKIFAGEYAAQSVAIASPDNENNWECALAEAAFMTGLERNADLVVMTSYAPLMAHADGWQWTPDLIWFNNLESYGTPNYYVQKLFANHAGTDLLHITSNGEAVTGQQDLYASAVKDRERGQLYIKVANTGAEAHSVRIELANAGSLGEATALTLGSPEGETLNSFAAPRRISPREQPLVVEGDQLVADVPAKSLVIYRVDLPAR